MAGGKDAEPDPRELADPSARAGGMAGAGNAGGRRADSCRAAEGCAGDTHADSSPGCRSKRSCQLQDVLGLSGAGRQCISLVGCQGKTTLLFKLSTALPQAIFGTTTQIFPLTPAQRSAYPQLLEASEPADLASDKPGLCAASHILLHGHINDKGKYSGAPQDLIDAAWESCGYPAVFEADGSRGMPLKAWAPYEPVIAQQTTITVGVLPLDVLYCNLDEEHIFRYQLFCERYGTPAVQPSEEKRLDLLARLTADSQGLFKGARGQRIIFFNKLDAYQERRDDVFRLLGRMKERLDGLGWRARLAGLARPADAQSGGDPQVARAATGRPEARAASGRRQTEAAMLVGSAQTGEVFYV